MTAEEQQFLKRINDYADEVLGDIDPQKVQISVQLEKLKPVMEELSEESGMPLEEVFIKYMDLASEAAVTREKEFQDEFQNPRDTYDFGRFNPGMQKF
ncbi:MAG: hypothetical protein IJ711_12115 [Lachnospiraceae bacterium]|nr:hypothetical protein [Lachnospiraceae bacterium]